MKQGGEDSGEDKHVKNKTKERDGFKEGRGNLTYFCSAYLYAEDSTVSQPGA